MYTITLLSADTRRSTCSKARTTKINGDVPKLFKFPRPTCDSDLIIHKSFHLRLQQSFHYKTLFRDSQKMPTSLRCVRKFPYTSSWNERFRPIEKISWRCWIHSILQIHTSRAKLCMYFLSLEYKPLNCFLYFTPATTQSFLLLRKKRFLIYVWRK
jgi:hypothetical protein